VGIGRTNTGTDRFPVMGNFVYYFCMKIILREKSAYLLRFDRGDDALEELVTFCKQHNIASAWFSGIGAADKVILSYYNLPTKSYVDKTFLKEVEVIGIMGNIAQLDGKTVLHCHGSIGDDTFQTFGGHIKKLVVSATLEVYLTCLIGKMTRWFHEETGLNLLQ